MWIYGVFFSLVIFTALGQTTIDQTNSSSTTVSPKPIVTSTEYNTSTSLVTSSSGSRGTTVSLRRCGNPGETAVCHFQDHSNEVCDICYGIICPHGMKCSKKKDKCEHECVCQNPTEIPDENSICRAACRMNPCHHNGSCRVEGKKQICDCVPGYDGDFCENVKNICLENQPSKCPTGAYECDMWGVNNYSCTCAAGYFADKDNHCIKVGHSAKMEIHFTETPYSEIYNDPKRPQYKEARDIIRYPFEQIFGERLVALEFHNFTQGSLVANLVLHLKPAVNGSYKMDEYMEHILQCSIQDTIEPECFGKLGRPILPGDTWKLQDERCANVVCPTGTVCQAIPGEAEKTRCICASGYKGYGSYIDSHGTTIEICNDIDECKTIEGVCEEEQSCVNIEGSFDCTTPCKDIICPGYAKCVAIDNGKYQCNCSWIYAGSACSFPWTLIFLSTTVFLGVATLVAGYLLWRASSTEKKGKSSRPYS